MIEKSILLELSFRIFIYKPTECVHLLAKYLFSNEEDSIYRKLIEKAEGFIMLSFLCYAINRF